MHHHHTAPHRGHSHQPEKLIFWAFALNVSFAIIELFGGIWLQSMAILADAIHDFGDSLTIGFAWYMQRLSLRNANQTYSYGYRRFSILSVIVISLILISGSAIIVYESVQRLLTPVDSPNPLGMVGFALFGILINGLAGKLLASGGSLHEQVLSWHFWEDMLGWVAVLIGGIAIYFTDSTWIDPMLSLGIAVFVAYRVFYHLKKAIAILLQAAPEHISVKQVEDKLHQTIQVANIRHTHLWTLDGQHHILTSHLVFDKSMPLDCIIAEKQKAHEALANMGIDHATLEIELTKSDRQESLHQADEKCE